MANQGQSAVEWFYGADAVAKHYADTLAVLDGLIAQSDAALRAQREAAAAPVAPVAPATAPEWKPRGASKAQLEYRAALLGLKGGR
jgi:hypothetical protein